jgi:hypothetical protein
MSRGKQFILTYWCGPRYDPELLDERYEDVVKAGVNVAAPSIDQSLSREQNLAILDVCERKGIPYIVQDPRMQQAISAEEGEWEPIVDAMMADFGDHPALYGYYLCDEPHSQMFQRLGDIAARLRAKDPTKLAYINLYPNYASLEQLGEPYEEHVENYTNIVKPSLLSYDHYHFLGRNKENANLQFESERERLIYLDAFKNEDRDGFFDNIEVIRRNALAHRVPFKVIVLLVSHGPYRELTEAELRWEVYHCLAYGTSGISHFTYWTPQYEEVWKFENGVITWDGEKTKYYDIVARLNKELHVLGNLLLPYQTTGVFHVGEEKENVTPFTGTPEILEITGGNATVGTFEAGYTVLVNKDYVHEKTFELRLAEGVQVCQIHKHTGEEEPLTAANGRVQLKLAAGDGVVLKFASYNNVG